MMISIVDADCHELTPWCYAVYGFEYKPGFENDNAVCTFFSCIHVSGILVDAISFLAQYISWINNKSVWTMNAKSTAANLGVNI